MPRPAEPLPPKEERLDLREAAQLFDPPSSKKALEGLIDRGKLRYAREGGAGARGRGARRVTTFEWLRSYAEASSPPRRLRSPAEAQADRTAVTQAWERVESRLGPEGDTAPLLELISQLGAENAALRARLAQLEAQLRQR